MLDPGTESIIQAVASPVIVVAILGYMIQRYINKNEEAMQNLSDEIAVIGDDISELKEKNAFAEGRNILISEMRKDLQDLRDEHTRTKSSTEALWRATDVKRMS